MIKEIIIITLVLLVVGLYFSPELTKSMIKTTSYTVWSIATGGVDETKEIENGKNITENLTNEEGEKG